MVFSNVQIYLDHPNWQLQSNPQQDSQELSPPKPQLPQPPPPAQLGGGGADTIRAGSMDDSARPTKLPLREAGLKCPRCESTNTKFCYFNNYNNSQPRHFCKTCRRYWTRGGSLRNVPVGGGIRRNNKRNDKASKTSSTSKPISITNDRHKGFNSNLTEMAVHHFPQQPVVSHSFTPHFLQNLPQYNGFQTRIEGASNSNHTDMGIHTSGGRNNSVLLSGGVDRWKLPLFGGLEPPIGLFPYQTDHQGLQDPSLMVGKSQFHPISSTSGITDHLGPVKLEENQRLNILSRQFSGISENHHQQWGRNTWPEIFYQ